MMDKKEVDCLDVVMTASEVAQVYNLAEPTVRQAIRRGTIKARKSAGTWLLKQEDADRVWGKSKNE